MEEQLVDFDEWYASFKPQEIVYCAVFNKETGTINSVGPIQAFEEEENKVILPKEVALDILEGKLSLSKCLVDIHSNEFQVAEVRSIKKIDDVLHRVITSEWIDSKDTEIFITCLIDEGKIEVELTDELGGTRISDKPLRKIVWEGSTEMSFFLTEYNDPHIVHNIFKLKVNDLQENKVIFENIDFPLDKFSIYTKRLFKGYVIELK